jgi:hypothetical protein
VEHFIVRHTIHYIQHSCEKHLNSQTLNTASLLSKEHYERGSKPCQLSRHSSLPIRAKNAIAGSDKAAGKPAISILTGEQLASWKAALMPVWDKWSTDIYNKGLPGRVIIDDIKTLNQKYSAINIFVG